MYKKQIGLSDLDFKNISHASGKTAGFYIHGFCSHGYSKNVYTFSEKFSKQNISFYSFTFYGNQKQHFHGNITIDSLVDNLQLIFDELLGKYAKVIPCASSLGGYVLGVFLKKYPKYIDKISNIILLCPALKLPERIEANKSKVGLGIWKIIRYIPRFHLFKKRKVLVNYKKFSQAKIYGNVDIFYTTLDIPIFIIHAKDDTVVPFSTSENISKNNHIYLTEGFGGHSLKLKFGEVLESVTKKL